MISHEHKIIFIHIPKCAGSSVEVYFNQKPFDWTKPNYKNLTGWCPKRKIHLQHATAKQLLDLDLIDLETWNTYYKFSIVRNPWSRSLSDYLWMNRNYWFKSTFKSYLNSSGRFKNILNDSSNKQFRGDHLISQKDFIYLNGKIVVDKIIHFENIKEEFKELSNKLNLPSEVLPHDKKSKKRFSHYSHFYSDKEIKMIREKYSKDIDCFNYQFQDKRNDFKYPKIHRIFGRL
jgi:hypothetical protein